MRTPFRVAVALGGDACAGARGGFGATGCRRVARLALVALGAAALLMTGVQFARGQAIVTNCTEAALRAALGSGTVIFGDDCAIALSSPIALNSAVTIDSGGYNVSISSSASNRLFNALANANLTLVGLTLTGGQSTNGGAIYVDSGAVVVLTNCTLSGNSAIGLSGAAGADGSNGPNYGGNGGYGQSGGAARGGAIYSLGTLSLFNCEVSTNSASGGSGGNGGNGGNGSLQGGDGGSGGNGGLGYGGAIYSGGMLIVSNCVFSGNTADGGSGGAGGTNGSGTFASEMGNGGAGSPGSGAGIYSVGMVTAVNCLFAGNAAQGGNSTAAGGIQANGDGDNASSGASSLGGGICSTNNCSVTNCTFYKNSTTGGTGGDGADSQWTAGNGGSGGNGAGGGLYSTGTNTVVNCTFVQNAAIGGTNGVAGTGAFPGENGNPGSSLGGGIARGGGVFILKNSIVATNLPGGNGNGTITDAGNNISSDSSFTLGTNSLKNTDAQLAGLADNGGPTATLALNSGSPAIDRGDDSACPPFDQRGVVRPVGTHCDIGAYEFGFQVQGQLTLDGNGLPDVLVTAGNQSATTDTNGDYTLYVGAGTNVVTPVSPDYDFAPPYQALMVETDTNGIDFSAVSVSYTISGHVLNGTSGLTGVTVTAGTDSAVTDANGAFSIPGLSKGTYSTYAALAGFRFSPAQDVTVGPDATNVDFLVTEQFFTISGQVTENGVGLSGVTVTATGLGRTTTDDNGFYQFKLAAPAGTYSVAPLSSATLQLGFSPGVGTVIVPPDATNVNFRAGPKITTITPLANGDVRLTFLAPSGQTNRIEASTNLINWVSLYTNTGAFTFLDVYASNFPARFYRSARP